ALPQTLAYLMGNPDKERPSYGIMTNGDEILFVKLNQKDSSQYNLSRIFTSFTSNQELYQVLQILKKLGNII
ncbi:MAG: type I restriction endonuclease subunit R, partial [Crocosphaera sp.]